MAGRGRGGTAVRPRPVDRATTKSPVRRPAERAAYRKGMTTGFGAGLTVALVIVLFAFLFGPGQEPTHHDPPAADAGAEGQTPQAAETPAPSAAVSVEARHEGNLELRIEARVAALESDAALLRAEVVAYTDMTSMPLSHRQGPITMTEIPGRPGYYEATTAVPMVGEYEVAVEAQSPLQGNATQVIEVGTVPAGGG